MKTNDGRAHAFSSEPGFRRSFWLLFLFSNFAIAQPLFDMMGSHAEFFVAHRSSPGFLISGALLLSFGIPLVASAVLLGLRGIDVRLARVFERICYAGLGGLAALTILNITLDLSTFLTVPLSVLIGSAVALGLSRSAGFDSFARFAAYGALVCPVAFLCFSPVTDLMIGDDSSVPARSRTVFRGPIFVIVFDEFSTVGLVDEELRIDASRFPNFARLAAKSDWFRQATTVTHSTVMAVPAILSGRYPEIGELPIVSHHPVNLFTILGDSYDVLAFQTVTDLCPRSVCAAEAGARRRSSSAGVVIADLMVVYLHLIVPSDQRDRLPPLAGQWTGFGAAMREKTAVEHPPNNVDRKDQFEEFVASIDPGEKPTLTFIHSLLPHVPYQFLPDGSIVHQGRRLPGWDRTREQWADIPQLVEQAYQRYLLQLGFVDRLLGTFLDRLEADGLFDDALIVVTADHGVNFLSGLSRRGISMETAPSILPVPLFIKRPRQTQGTISDANVEIIDILPTLADLIGLEPIPDFDGVSVLGDGPAERSSKHAIYWGETLEFPADLSDRMREEALRVRRFLPAQEGRRDTAALRALPDQVGSAVGDYDKGVDSDEIIALDDAYAYVNAQPADAFRPVLLTGRLLSRRGDEEPTLLFAALRDRIVGVARTYREAGAHRFSILLRSEDIDPAGNQFSFYLDDRPSGPDAPFVLSAVGLNLFEPSEFPEPATAGSLPEIRYRGRIYTPSSEKPVGGVSHFESIGDVLRIAGWAGEQTREKPALAILVLSMGQVVHEYAHLLDRPDVAKAMGSGYLRSGFDFAIADSLVDDSNRAGLHVVALFEGGKAVDLRLPEIRAR